MNRADYVYHSILFICLYIYSFIHLQRVMLIYLLLCYDTTMILNKNNFCFLTCITRTYATQTLFQIQIISFVSRTCNTKAYTIPTWLQIQMISFVSRTCNTRTYTTPICFQNNKPVITINRNTVVIHQYGRL
jgi:hypothetical protein